MPRWEVPYQSRDRTLVRCGFASTATVCPLILLGTLPFSDPRRLRSWIVGLLLAAFSVTMTWRLVLVGVLVGDQGTTVNMVGRTRVGPRSEFDRVWLVPAAGQKALALWISVRDGPDVETPVGREATRVMHRNRIELQQPEGVGAQLEALGGPEPPLFDAAAELVNFILGVAGQSAANARALSDRTASLNAVAAQRTKLDPAGHTRLHRAVVLLPDHDGRRQFLAGTESVYTNERQ